MYIVTHLFIIRENKKLVNRFHLRLMGNYGKLEQFSYAEYEWHGWILTKIEVYFRFDVEDSAKG